MNRDGFPDLVVGARSAMQAAGSALVYSGKDGTKLWQFDGGNANASLGWSVAGAGDVNQDGFDDIIVGAPAHQNFDLGSAFVEPRNHRQSVGARKPRRHGDLRQAEGWPDRAHRGR